MQKRACRPAGHGEHARLSAVAGGLLGRRDGVGRWEEPPRDESGFRAHGSNQRFHRLLRHAVARALTTAPSLAGVSPAAPQILTPQGWGRKRRPGRCRTKNRRCEPATNRHRAGWRRLNEPRMRLEKTSCVVAFSSRTLPEPTAAHPGPLPVVTSPQEWAGRPLFCDSLMSNVSRPRAANRPRDAGPRTQNRPTGR